MNRCYIVNKVLYDGEKEDSWYKWYGSATKDYFFFVHSEGWPNFNFLIKKYAGGLNEMFVNLHIEKCRFSDYYQNFIFQKNRVEVNAETIEKENVTIKIVLDRTCHKVAFSELKNESDGTYSYYKMVVNEDFFFNKSKYYNRYKVDCDNSEENVEFFRKKLRLKGQSGSFEGLFGRTLQNVTQDERMYVLQAYVLHMREGHQSYTLNISDIDDCQGYKLMYVVDKWSIDNSEYVILHTKPDDHLSPIGYYKIV